MGSKITVSAGENEKKQVMLLQAPGALLARAAFQIIADHGSSNTNSQSSSRSFSEDTCYGAGCLLGFHSNAVLKTWVKRVLMYFEITIDKKEKQRFN